MLMNKKITLTTLAVLLGFLSLSRAQVPAYVPTNGLVGWWPFNGNANDESGNGYNLINSSVTFENDRQNTPNSAAYFSGINTELKSQTSFIQFTTSPQQTYSFWFKNVISNWRYIVNYANSSKTRISICPNTLVAKKSLAVVGFDGCHNCGIPGGLKEVEAPGLETNWHHLVVSVSNDTCSIYYDDNLILAEPHTGFNCLDTSFRFVLGNDIVCAPEYYNMYLDDVGVWNRALTKKEITNLFNAPKVHILSSSKTRLLSVYPNPFGGEINIKADKAMISSIYSVRDNTGKTVTSGKISIENATLNLGHLSSGIYWISVGNEQQETIRIIKE